MRRDDGRLVVHDLVRAGVAGEQSVTAVDGEVGGGREPVEWDETFVRVVRPAVGGGLVEVCRLAGGELLQGTSEDRPAVARVSDKVGHRGIEHLLAGVAASTRSCQVLVAHRVVLGP